MKSWLKNNIFVLLLFLITSFIAYQTYEKGTILSGWDTLHPEFDFELNFKRLFFGVWRQEQGLGAVAAHSHMADLPRVIFLWLLHFIVPLNLLRYSYIFLCLILGPIGMLFFIRFLLFKIKSNPTFINAIPFISGLYYLLNFSTIQQFYVPFEMFPTQYAFLPWALLFSYKYYFGKREKGSLILFGLITLFGTPQAYAAHLWYPFFGVYFLALCILILIDKFKKESVKKFFVLIAMTLAINSFWLFPNIYYIVTQSNTPITSKQNRLSSQEFQLKNRVNGNISDVALIKGFYFDWNAFDFQLNKTSTLMPEWSEYINRPYVKYFGYMLFSFSFLGFLISVFKKNILFGALTPFLLLPFVLLMNNNPPFDSLFNLLNTIPLFEEAMRFIFTKLSILLLFGYCVFFAFFISTICEFLNSRKYKVLVVVLLGTIFVGLIYYVKPIFAGRLISTKMKIQIPQEYFELWKYMKGQKEGTILPLPLHTFSGWQYYNFGYQGAGFLWFGLKNPILDRDFDRWNIRNEQAYNEFHNAIYSQNPEQFDLLTNKYKIQYLLWDHNVISPEQKNQNQLLFLNETDTLIQTLILKKKLVLQKSFSNSLFLYRVNRITDEIEVNQIQRNVLPTYDKNFRDFAFFKIGNYISSEEMINTGVFPTYYYPFRDILNDNESLNLNKVDVSQDSHLQFSKQNAYNSLRDISLPKLSEVENILFASIDVVPEKSPSQQYKVSILPNLPLSVISPIITFIKPEKSLLSIDDSFLFFHDPVLLQKKEWISSLFLNTRRQNSINDFHFTPDTEKRELPIDKIGLLKAPLYLLPKPDVLNSEMVMKSLNSSKDVVVSFPDIPHNLGYVIAIDSRYVGGLPLRICVKNVYSGLCDLYTDVSKNREFKTEYFPIPPTDENGGYRIEITSRSIGDLPSVSYVRQVNLFPIQYNYLSNIRYFNKEDDKPAIYSEGGMLSSYSLPYYKSTKIDTTVRIEPNTVITMNQAFHAGWKIYQINCQLTDFACAAMKNLPFFFGSELKGHVLVNNWANGWIVPSRGTQIVIVFLPQYLQFAGFVLLIFTFFLILVFSFLRKRFTENITP